MRIHAKPDLSSFLERLCSHSQLAGPERDAVLALPRHAVQIGANRDIVRLGEVMDHACLVGEGLVGRFGQNAEGERQITALHIPGDMADLHSVVLPTAQSALQALTASTILRVPHAAIRALAARFPAIAEALWRDCTVDAAILSQWVVNVGRRDARTRIAHFFCEMAIRYGKPPADTRFAFDFGITQVQLADATGLTAVHVNRTLQALRKDGLVDVHHGRATIHDWRALAAAGEFDPHYLHRGTAAPPPARLLQLA